MKGDRAAIHKTKRKRGSGKEKQTQASQEKTLEKFGLTCSSFLKPPPPPPLYSSVFS